MKHRTLTPDEIRDVIELQTRLLEQAVYLKHYQDAHDCETRIRVLRIVLGEYDSEGLTPEDKKVMA